MQKRGQVSLFIVLGIVIVVVIVLGLVFRSQISELVSETTLVKSEAAKAMEANLRAYAGDCLKKVTTEGVQTVLAGGGYYKNAKKTVDYDIFEVPYYLYEKKEYAPKLKDVAVSLARYIEENLNTCFLAYPEELDLKKPDIGVSLGKKVEVEAEHTITLSTDEVTVRVKNYNAEVECDVSTVYDSAMNFYEEVKNLSATGFVEQAVLSFEQNHEFYYEAINENELVFTLSFPGAIEKEKDTYYNFAMKYPKVEEESFFEELLSLFSSQDMEWSEDTEDLEIPDDGSMDEEEKEELAEIDSEIAEIDSIFEEVENLDTIPGEEEPGEIEEEVEEEEEEGEYEGRIGDEKVEE